MIKPIGGLAAVGGGYEPGFDSVNQTGQHNTTGKDPDLLRMYLEEIGRHPLLTQDDEFRLGEEIAEGRAAAQVLAEHAAGDMPLNAVDRQHARCLVSRGETATTTFVQSNLRLVVSIAKYYQSSGVSLLDLIQEGNFGLMHAVEKFDHTKGFKFSTYATWWIRQAITRGIANTGLTIRVPIHAADRVKRVVKTRERLENEKGSLPTLKHLADATGLPVKKLVEVLSMPSEPVSIFEPLRDQPEIELGETIEDPHTESPEASALTTLLPNEIVQMLSCLDEREREVLWLRFGFDGGGHRSLSRVAEESDLNLTPERVRQIEQRAMSKLRHPSNYSGGRDLLLD